MDEERIDLSPTPDLTTLSDAELKGLIGQLTAEEREISFKRRFLHGQIEVLKAELVRRLKGRDEGELSVVDVEALSRILAGRLPEVEALEGRGD